MFACRRSASLMRSNSFRSTAYREHANAQPTCNAICMFGDWPYRRAPGSKACFSLVSWVFKGIFTAGLGDPLGGPLWLFGCRSVC